MSSIDKRSFLKYSIAGLTAAGAGTSFLSTALAADKMPESKAGPSKDKEGVQYLFVQTAHSISSKGDKLTLHGVTPLTLFFSDRPERVAGHGATTELVADWNKGEDSFASDPPNATLALMEKNDDLEDVVVELSNPVLDGDNLTYTVKVINGKLPASGGPSSLFIDIIGRPLTPVSYAGVARRTRRRVVY